MLHGKEYGNEVKAAKKELDLRVEDFNEQAQLCAQRRLARIEDSVQSLGMAVQKLGAGGPLIGGYLSHDIQDLQLLTKLLLLQKSEKFKMMKTWSLHG